jgi:hypothetical protein
MKRVAKKSSKVVSPKTMRAAEALLEALEGGDYTATGPKEVIDQLWRIIHQKMLNRVPDERDSATIRELKAKGWSVSAIASGLELKSEAVANIVV